MVRVELLLYPYFSCIRLTLAPCDCFYASADCYVAVTGLPTPEVRHAVIMVKFAMDCRYKMGEITRQLEATLGPDTGSLALRVGLHSGPTTAGVLRGAKSRFQLFGDTVNTAARMESNGLPQKIHVSQVTADLLVAAGKRCWLVKRDELIEAKGKGKMQTWWVNPSPSGAASVAALSCDDSSCVERPPNHCSASACGELSDADCGELSNADDDHDEGIELLGGEDNMADLEPPTTLDGMITMPRPGAAANLDADAILAIPGPVARSESNALSPLDLMPASKPLTKSSDEISNENDGKVTSTVVTTLEEFTFYAI